jgi:small-conductance mechanosensitive channel
MYLLTQNIYINILKKFIYLQNKKSKIMKNILDQVFLGNTVKDYLISLIAFVIVAIILWVFKRFFINRLKKIAKKTKTEIDDVLIKCLQLINWPLYLAIALWVAFKFIYVAPNINKIYNYFVTIIIIYYVVKIIIVWINYFTDNITKKRVEEGRATDAGIIKLINNILKGILWSIAILILLDNFGVNITTLIAGLGIGGIAIAFALQAILGDVMASFSIYFDRPFDIGDFIIVDNLSGNVKKIGIKSTKIDSLSGEEIIIPNKDLGNSRVRNYKRMQKRRILFTLRVTYETPLEKLKMIPDIITKIVNENEICNLDRVNFYKFGDYSLIFEVVYYVLDPDYKVYMDIQQKINFEIKESFEKEGIEFAYPTHTLFVNPSINNDIKTELL